VTSGSHWQRWTIDELAEGLARILVAGAKEPLESSLAEALDTAATPDVIQEAVTRVEDLSPDELWTEEQQAYLRADLLEPFVRLRAPVPGLPDPRPLREGDVFWVVLPTTDQESTLADLTPAQVVASADQLEIQVSDITAAARQRAKVANEAALRAGSKVGQEMEAR
jgi:hypothetical protein